MPIIRKKFPNAKIGFICSSYSKEILKNNQFIDKIYIVDHWRLNRESISFTDKIIKYIVSRFRAIKEIKKEKYDVGVDLYYYFPNTIDILWKAKIPIRIGYTSAGFKNFLTNSLDWKNQDKHVSLYHFDLIKFLGIEKKDKRFLKINLPLFPQKNDIKLPDNFIIFHIGAGNEIRKWNINKWKILTKNLVEKGKSIIFTGKGQKENKQINEIIKGETNCLNFCNKLRLQDLIEIINKAKIVVCVDSLVLHISTALNKTTFVIFGGISNKNHWILKKSNIHIISKTLKCSPCFDGCQFMKCINEIEVKDVLSKMENIYD